MAVAIGSLNLDNCALGAEQVDRIMLGTIELWSAGGNFFRIAYESGGMVVYMYDRKGVQKWATTPIKLPSGDYGGMPFGANIAGVNKAKNLVYVAFLVTPKTGITFYGISMASGAIVSQDQFGPGYSKNGDVSQVSRYYESLDLVLSKVNWGSTDETTDLFTRNMKTGAIVTIKTSSEDEGTTASRGVGSGYIYTGNNRIYHFESGYQNASQYAQEFSLEGAQIAEVPFLNRDYRGTAHPMLDGNYLINGSDGTKFGTLIPTFTEAFKSSSTFVGGIRYLDMVMPEKGIVYGISSTGVVHKISLSTKSILDKYTLNIASGTIEDIMMDDSMTIYLKVRNLDNSTRSTYRLDTVAKTAVKVADVGMDSISPGNFESDVKAYPRISV